MNDGQAHAKEQAEQLRELWAIYEKMVESKLFSPDELSLTKWGFGL